MAITVALQHAQFQLGAGSTEGASLTSPSGTWANGDGVLFCMAIHHNSLVARDMIGLTASAGSISSPVFTNAVSVDASYHLDGGYGLATVTSGFTGTLTGTRTADTADQWLTASVLKLTGHGAVRQSKIGGDITAATDITVTLDSAPLSDSLLVAICVSNGNTDWNLATGWDAKTGLNETGWGGSHTTQWKLGGGSTSTTFTKPTGAASAAFVIEIPNAGPPAGAGTLSVFSMGNGAKNPRRRIY